MQNRILNDLVSLKQFLKRGIAFLFVILFFGIIFGCKGIGVKNQSRKTEVANSIEKIKVQQLVKSSVSWNNVLLPVYPKGEPEITILRIVVPVGAVLEKHKHPVINAGVLIKGELTVQTIDGKKLYLKAQDTIVETVNTWHYGKNEGIEPAEIIVFYSGVKGTPITVGEI